MKMRRVEGRRRRQNGKYVLKIEFLLSSRYIQRKGRRRKRYYMTFMQNPIE